MKFLILSVHNYYIFFNINRTNTFILFIIKHIFNIPIPDININNIGYTIINFFLLKKIQLLILYILLSIFIIKITHIKIFS